MDKEKAVLSLIFLTVIASGCIGGGDEPTGSVTVNELRVQPTQIFESQSVRAWVDISNTGSLPATVTVGEGGENIIRNFCPDVFRKAENGFSASTSQNPSLTPEQQRNPVTLKPGYNMRLNWELENRGNTPLYGERCELEFAVPFNYSVSAYRQVQIKEDRQVEGSTNLQYERSSGPLGITIETLPGSTGKRNTFIANGEDENREATFLIRFVNERPNQEYTKGLISINKDSLKIESTDPLVVDERVWTLGEEVDLEDEGSYINMTDIEGGIWARNPFISSYEEPRCDVPGEEIRLNQGKSTVIRCNVPLPKESELDAPSKLSELSVNVNYTYVKDAGTRTVEVKSRGQ